jgi:uncharacterized SAM-binding protein YcdF (DUF218 family)
MRAILLTLAIFLTFFLFYFFNRFFVFLVLLIGIIILYKMIIFPDVTWKSLERSMTSSPQKKKRKRRVL